MATSSCWFITFVVDYPGLALQPFQTAWESNWIKHGHSSFIMSFSL
jgi:hypothetical protein